MDHLLSMLSSFLQSNKSLSLNDTFKVYLKVLSAEHSQQKFPIRRKQKRKTGFGRLHVGSDQEQAFKSYWAIDVPNGSEKMPGIFKNLCLLTCTVLGIAQHDLHLLKSKDFTYLSLLQSPNERKVHHGVQILQKRLP